MARRSGQDGSTLLLDEHFAGQDPRFVETLRTVHSPKKLAALADRWTADPRPWARGQMFLYVAEPMDRPGHQPLVKRLFKHAEADGDDELMAAFMVTFDVLIRRVRKKRYHYDYQTHQVSEVEYLKTPRNTLPTGGGYARPSDRLFSYRTRYYLRRRAWRYFRRMGFQRPDDYCQAVARALKAYRDDDLAKGEHILDSWGLMHACFRYHEAVGLTASRFTVAEGHSLGELSPAPRFPQLWQAEPATGVLFDLAAGALCRLVRVWAMDLLRAHHAERLTRCTPEQIIALLDHADEEVQQFGAELFSNLEGLESLPVATWLRLLATKNPTALTIICQTMTERVSPQRLDLGQCIDLTCAAPVPVARLGFAFLKQRPIATDADRGAIARLAEAKCSAVAGELTAWALAILGSKQCYDREAVTGFFDALVAESRTAAWKWLTPESPGYDDPQLWARLLETPYDDVRMRVVDLLERRAKLPGVGADRLTPIWCAVLLGVHRGGRQKLKAVRQLAKAVGSDPTTADRLLPILAVAVRSIRGPEHRAALAAVVGLFESDAALAAKIGAVLPELQVPVEESAG